MNANATFSYCVICARCKRESRREKSWLATVAVAVADGWEVNRAGHPVHVTEHDRVSFLCPDCKGGAK